MHRYTYWLWIHILCVTPFSQKSYKNLRSKRLYNLFYKFISWITYKFLVSWHNIDLLVLQIISTIYVYVYKYIYIYIYSFFFVPSFLISLIFNFLEKLPYDKIFLYFFFWGGGEVPQEIILFVRPPLLACVR